MPRDCTEWRETRQPRTRYQTKVFGPVPYPPDPVLACRVHPVPWQPQLHCSPAGSSIHPFPLFLSGPAPLTWLAVWVSGHTLTFSWLQNTKSSLEPPRLAKALLTSTWWRGRGGVSVHHRNFGSPFQPVRCPALGPILAQPHTWHFSQPAASCRA